MSTEKKKKKELPVATPEQSFAAKKVLDGLLVYFMHDAPWASHIYYMMEKTEKPGMGTMGVAVKADRIQLYYDPLFVLSMDRAEIGFVMIHEAFHVLFHHCTKRIPLDRSQKDKWNNAADLAINCLIPRSSTCMMPVFKVDPVPDEDGRVPTINGRPVKKGDHKGLLPADFKLEDKKAMEWYFDALPSQKGGGSGDGDGESTEVSLDSHDDWEPSDLIDAEIANTVERIDKSRAWGNMPGDLVQGILAAQKTEVPWNKILRHLIGDLISKNKVKSTKKVNRRMPFYPFKGDIKTGVDRKLVAFDTSGSVGDEELAVFLAEVNVLVEDEQPVDAICFDHVVQTPKPVAFTRRRPSFDMKGRGGTSFTPVVEFAKEHRYKHLIILTDGQAETPPHVLGLDIIWVLTPDGNDQPPAGSQGRWVKMKKLKNRAFR